MKKSFWFSVSAMLNIGLAVIVFAVILDRAPPRPPPVANGVNAASARGGASPGNQPVPRTRAGSETNTATAAITTAAPLLISTNQIAPSLREAVVTLTGIVPLLRNAGVSEDVLADVISAQLQRQQKDDQRQLISKARRGEINSYAQAWDYVQKEAEREQAIKAVLGKDAFVHWDKKNVLDWVSTDGVGLSAAESDTLYQIQKERQRLDRELSHSRQVGEVDQYDSQAQRAEIQKEYDSRLAELLGPDRATKLKKDNDWEYGRLRWDLRELNLSDEQDRALYRATQQYSGKVQELERLSQSGTPIDGRQLQELRISKEKEIEQILGPQGHADYKKVQDPRYREMKQYSAAWQLSADDIDFVYKTLEDSRRALLDYRKRVQEFELRGQPVNPGEIERVIKDFEKLTETDLRRRLSDARFDKLKRAGVIQLRQ